jgi:hypothetical protein
MSHAHGINLTVLPMVAKSAVILYLLHAVKMQ